MPSGTSQIFKNINALWGAIFARTLVKSGVQHVVVSPGSRSTPLTYALACEQGLQTVPVLDERTAAFYALGLAKATHHPVAIVCTSGTATANYLPAIVEAWHAEVPLLVVTADRPPELRNCGAGQTIDQIRLYGTHVVWEVEAALPDSSEKTLEEWRNTVSKAVACSQGQRQGPVHLNVPLRDPLPPSIAQNGFAIPKGFDLESFCHKTSSTQQNRSSSSDSREIMDWAGQFSHGVIVAGAANPPDIVDYANAITSLAKSLDWPVLADALNPLRHTCDDTDNVIWCYDTILRNKEYADSLKPEAVIQLGQLPTSKVLRDWLQQANLPTLLFSAGGQNLNPLHKNHRLIPYSITDFRWEQKMSANNNPNWITQWLDTQNHAGGKLVSLLKNEVSPFEGKIACLLAEHLPEDAAFMIANSMPVRDAEYFWPSRKTHRRVFSNRGANGIDGTLGTAMGIASGTQSPTFLLTDNFSLLHDSNALLLTHEFQGNLTVILINNNGGGIFNHLPVAQENPYFERFWGTPQVVDFAKLADAYQVKHVLIHDWAQLAQSIEGSPQKGLRILELRTNREIDTAMRRKLLNG